MAMPSRVKANGRYRVPPQFDVPFWNIKSDFSLLNSSLVSWNIKSGGKRLILRFTALFKLPVVTWYNSAKSRSSITRCPRISYILLWIVCISFILFTLFLAKILTLLLTTKLCFEKCTAYTYSLSRLPTLLHFRTRSNKAEVFGNKARVLINNAEVLSYKCRL